MGIEASSVSYGGGDYRWLKSARGFDTPVSGTVKVSTFTITGGYIPSGTPVKLNAGLYEVANATATATTLAGFLAHDVSAATGGANQPCAILTDATIIKAFLPGTNDLVDGRYLTDAKKVGA